MNSIFSKTIFIPLTALLLLPAAGYSFTVKTTAADRLVHWPDDRSTIFYVVNPGEEKSGAVRSLGEAFSTWVKNSRGRVKFIFSGWRPGKEAKPDGVNTVAWVGEDWRYRPEVVAMSSLWYSETSGEIKEADIEFNARDYSWTPEGGGGALSIREIALHEIGHLLGIDHSFNPSAVMFNSICPRNPIRVALTRDDREALWFVYPRQSPSFISCDIPALLYPRQFPVSEVRRSLPALPSPAGRWLTALGGVDADGDGFQAEICGAFLDRKGRYTLQEFSFLPAGGRFREISSPRRLLLRGEITALTGLDLNRDGVRDEIAVLIRQGAAEDLNFYTARPDSFERRASLSLQAPPANDVIGMAALEGGAGENPVIAVLRSRGGGFSLYLYPVPEPGDEVNTRRAGTELRLPGFHRGSRLLGLAALDAVGDGEEEDLVVVEKTPEGRLWIHAFSFLPARGENPADLSYLNSAPLGSDRLQISPPLTGAIDLNRDGYLNELILLSPTSD